MKLRPLLRLFFLMTIFVILFFSTVLVFVGQSSLSGEMERVQREILEQEVSIVNYRGDIEISIDNTLRNEAEYLGKKRVNLNDTIPGGELGEVEEESEAEDARSTNENNVSLIGF